MPNLASAKLLMIGCGNMGRPILSGVMEAGVPNEHIAVAVLDDAQAEETKTRFSVSAFSAEAVRNGAFDGKKADILIYAAKPQEVSEGILTAYAKPNVLNPEALIITIAAGLPSSAFRDALHTKHVVRVMPNTPAMVGQGIAAAYAPEATRNRYAAWVDALLSRTGQLIWIEDECLMHVITACSGSGPAYVFYLMECLCQNGESVAEVLQELKDGAAPLPHFRDAWIKAAMQVNSALPEDKEPCYLTEIQAKILVEQTIKGAITLTEYSGEAPSILRAKVTSKKGTTEAGLNALMRYDLTQLSATEMDTLLYDTLEAATQRSHALSQGKA